MLVNAVKVRGTDGVVRTVELLYDYFDCSLIRRLYVVSCGGVTGIVWAEDIVGKPFVMEKV